MEMERINLEPWVSIATLADAYGISAQDARRKVKAMEADPEHGKMVVRIGRLYRVRLSDFHAYLERRRAC